MYWLCHYNKDIIYLEQVQRRATKLVVGLQTKNYGERLKAPDLYFLIIETYKILTSNEDINRNQFFELSTKKFTRGHSMKL